MKMRSNASVILMAILATLGNASFAEPALAQSPQPPVVTPSTGGASYSELSARWWQWLLSIRAAVNPNLDETGVNCEQGQNDDVWFLAGAFGGTFKRSCTVPAGKPIFFPVVTSIGFKPWGYETLMDLRGQVGAFIDGFSRPGGAVNCTVDGASCFGEQAPSAFRVRSPAFTVMAPARGVLPPGQLSVPGNTDPIVSDGYWVLLEPLAAGNHTIQFDATAVDADGDPPFSLNVTYDLVVQ